MPTSKISLYFMGTDAFAATCLERLLEDDQYAVLGVVVPPDAKVGRKQELVPCAVKVLAEERGLEIFHEATDLMGHEMDFLVVVSYGRILAKEILALPKVAALNVHGSLLPKYRGASPISTTIVNGDDVTGVCVVKMVEKLDAGPVYALAELIIEPEDDVKTLRARMAGVGAELLAQVMPGIASGTVEPQEQDESHVSYAKKVDRESGRIDWEEETAQQIEHKMRAYRPWPGIFTEFDGKRLKIHMGMALLDVADEPGMVMAFDDQVGVGTTDGLFVIDSVQLEGKQTMSIQDFVRGNPGFVGARLG